MLKALGILLAIAGAIVLCTGVAAIAARADGELVAHSTIIVRMFGGFFLLAAGGFISVFAFSAGLRRGAFSLFKRLQGGRVDEEIARLAKLRADGYITGEEYDAAKKKLLSDL